MSRIHAVSGLVNRYIESQNSCTLDLTWHNARSRGPLQKLGLPPTLQSLRTSPQDLRSPSARKCAEDVGLVLRRRGLNFLLDDNRSLGQCRVI